MPLLVSEVEVVLTTLSSIFPQPTKSVSSTMVPMLTPTPGEPRLSTIEKDAGSNLPTNISNSTTTEKAGISGWKIAVIATFTTLLLLLALLLAGLVLVIVVYRRWRVEQMKRTLLEIRPAHLAIGMEHKWCCSSVFCQLCVGERSTLPSVSLPCRQCNVWPANAGAGLQAVQKWKKKPQGTSRKDKGVINCQRKPLWIPLWWGTKIYLYSKKLQCPKHHNFLYHRELLKFLASMPL